ncbi:MAG: glycosyltransferase family 4 protein, partial [bacterium]|nr:glycosyltransferase family 4 protein [bacterium]
MAEELKNKKSIIICTGIFPPDIGGPASYGKTMSDALTERGFKAEVITYRNLKSDYKSYSYKISSVSRKWPGFLGHLIYFFKVFLLANKFDTIFALNAVSAGVPAALAAKFKKKKFVVKIVGDYAWERAVITGKTVLMLDDFQKSKKTGWIGILHKMQRWTCRRADRIIVPSEYLAKIVREWGVQASKVRVVFNGTDFRPSDLSKEEARKIVRVPGNIILSAGRLVPWKGFKMLIKIMPKILELSQFFRLVIVGSGPDIVHLERMVKNMNLSSKVILAGSKNKEELAVFMKAADLFVLNTGYEGFSHQLLEAMTAGVPIITTGVGGNREVIHQGENGFMVRYNDEFNLFEAIKTLWQSKEMQERFVEKGKET